MVCVPPESAPEVPQIALNRRWMEGDVAPRLRRDGQGCLQPVDPAFPLLKHRPRRGRADVVEDGRFDILQFSPRLVQLRLQALARSPEGPGTPADHPSL